VVLKFIGAHQLPVYVDYVYVVRNNVDILKKGTKTITGASKEVSVEVNADKTKYMLLSLHKNMT
jgi:hypothetical protein